jgi:predicted ATP-grasp superfamily ATP-dependent carboligase
MPSALTSPAVLVSTANQQLACLIAADLAARGVRVEAAVDHPLSPCRLSRFVSACHRAPPAGSGEEYVRTIIRLVKSRKIDLFLPSCRDSIELSPFAGLLRRETRYPFPDRPTMHRVADKCELWRAARQAGLPVPASHIDAAPRADCGLRFPVVCKPADGFGAQGFFLAEDPEQLRRRAATLDRSRRWLLQEYIQGPLMVWMGIRWNGVLQASFAFLTERTTPAFGGSSVLRRSVVDPNLDRISMRLLDSIGYEGFCTLDYLREERSGVDYLIDFNPRFGTSLHAAAIAGVSFPECLLRLTTGTPFTRPIYREGVTSSSLAGHIGRVMRPCPRKPPVRRLILDAARAFCHAGSAEETFRASPVLMAMPFFNILISLTPGLRSRPLPENSHGHPRETTDLARR